MSSERTWFIPAGSSPKGRADLRLTPESAGWTYCGMYVYTLRTGDPAEFTLDGEEGVLVSLSARDFTVTVDGTDYPMTGRDGVFAAVSDWMYLPVGSRVSIAGDAGEVAIVTARASESFPVHYGPADSVPVEVRGAGRSTRQVTNYATPDSFMLPTRSTCAR